LSALPAAHRDSGLRALLDSALLYSFLQRLLGAKRARRVFAKDFVRAESGQRILDIGCGTASLLEHLPEDIEYVGCDLNPNYVARATKLHGHRAEFWVADARALHRSELKGPFDRVLLVALLHHLDNSQAESLLGQAAQLLAPQGKLVTIDSVLVDDQPWLARFLIEQDRGARARTAGAYLRLLRQHFSSVRHEIRSDLLRVPYTHILAEATLDE